MSKERLYLYDTTLRDGAQTTGVDFSISDKRRIMAVLDDLGIDFIEGGYPGANPTDTELFSSRPALKSARFTAFGMTKRAGRSVSNDPGLQSILQSTADSICLVAKSWDYHVRVALGITNEENLEAVEQSVKAVLETQREAMIDCEHFFDGYKGNRAYALAVAKTAFDSGARWVVLCDTNGGTLPHEVDRIVADVAKHIPGANLGIHTHNDTDNAVANTLMAVRAGCRQIQGTLNGLGERCGNANMTSIIPTLLLKSEFADAFETGVTPDRLRNLTHASRVLDEILNEAPDRHAPYVGESAFATKAGIHASALLKDPQTYEHVPPEAVGNERRILVSKQGGRSSILASLEKLGIDADKDDPKITALLDEVRNREDQGYAYEAAQASFELLARRMLDTVPRYFSVENFRVMVERRRNALGKLVSVSEP
jgi:2-isopropylmalate synthase